MSPKDLFNIAKKFGITPKAALTQYCETYIRCNSRFPVVCLKPQGTIKRCPLLKNRKCMVPDVKPAVCAMFPIGRYLALPTDGNVSENLKESSAFSGRTPIRKNHAPNVEYHINLAVSGL